MAPTCQSPLRQSGKEREEKKDVKHGSLTHFIYRKWENISMTKNYTSFYLFFMSYERTNTEAWMFIIPGQLYTACEVKDTAFYSW